MAKRATSKPKPRASKAKVGGANRKAAKRQRAKLSTLRVGTALDWDDRYGDIKKYKQMCAIAHKSTKGFCCCCLKKKSTEVHHTKYGSDRPGVTVFPLCKACHDRSHKSENWVKSKSNPVWDNHATANWEERLKLGFKLLSEGLKKAEGRGQRAEGRRNN